MYERNPSLRSEGETIEYTAEMIAEWIRCKEDIIYFAEKYFYITSIDEGKIIIKLRDYQKRMLKAFIGPNIEKRHRIVLSGRQSGKTQVSCIFMAHYMLFNQDKFVAILANNERTASDILRKIKESYESLPLWLQQGVSQAGWSKTQIKLENGNIMISGSTSSNGIRGRTINLLFLDEFAFVPNNMADAFISSVYPTISSGKKSQIIMVSTPKGMNHFHTIWTKSVEGKNNFLPIKVNWWEVPGRDEEWKKATIADIGPIKWNQEFECKFLGSAATLIDPELLERMGVYMEDPIELKYNGALKIYERPEEGAMYILGVDSASGSGGDYSVTQVLKLVDEHNIEQVATFESNTMSYVRYAEAVIGISEYYNECYIMLENNDIGAQVANTIWHDYEYDKIINVEKKQLGIRSTRKSKLAANMLLKRYAESGWLELRDVETLRQLTMYEEVSPNVYRASSSEHDDHITSLIWGLYFVNTIFFDSKDLSIKKIDPSFKLGESERKQDDVPIVFSDEPAFDEDGFDWS